jgi:hypothetical protein
MNINPGTWAAVVVAICTVIGAIAGLLRFMIIHYLNELKPNGGSSLKDAVKRLEHRVDDLFTLIAEKM